MALSMPGSPELISHGTTSFSLTTKQHRPAYRPQKPSGEQPVERDDRAAGERKGSADRRRGVGHPNQVEQ